MFVNDLTYLRENGEFFGYPSCCIDHFVASFGGPLEATAAQQLVREYPEVASFLYGSGYIPCPHCAAAIQKEGFASFFWRSIAPFRTEAWINLAYWL